MFHLTIDCKSSCSVEVIAAMAEIENSDGMIVVAPDQLALFLGTILDGISTISIRNGHRYIVGNKQGQFEEWSSVSGMLRDLADKIDNA
jgi:hypothetical protein